MTFISYAQNYEDVILWRALRDVNHGLYVDVEAGDPEELSVTRAFYERGWSGINVEHLDQHLAKLAHDRPRDTNLKAAVGREAGLRSFHAIEETGLSTLDPQIAARQQAAGWEVHDTVVPILTLAKILEDCAPPTIHFLKIDVEGTEAEVLEGLNLERIRPWSIVIEATAPSFVTEGSERGSQLITRENWEHLIVENHYRFAKREAA
jgi:FkbM family methyltransferase